MRILSKLLVTVCALVKIQGAAPVVEPHAVERHLLRAVYDELSLPSIELNAVKSQYLYRARREGSVQIFTISLWFKHEGGQLSRLMRMDGSTPAAYTILGLTEGAHFGWPKDSLGMEISHTGGAIAAKVPSLSSWHHLVFTADTTKQSEDRITLYLDGDVVARYAFVRDGGLPSIASSTFIGMNSTHNNNCFFKGHIADVYGVDGIALDPTSFAEQRNGQWLPKQYVGEYGDAGFHLDFKDLSNLGKDVSGNQKGFTVINGPLTPTANSLSGIHIKTSPEETLGIVRQLATEAKQQDSRAKLDAAYKIADHFPDAQKDVLRAAIDAAYGAAIPRIENTVPQAQADRLALLRSLAERTLNGH